ncbi:protein tyrosine phosphatase [Streptomyces sp. Ru73]|uniref:low molecular weight protein-tyrosine-phosphatase n=1 Tax=Streptomyces sp. Ru73 TaxID=2080748 RepID=UPI000CDE268F|nr:protein tyrosine phosphatase [Streptomyces sp. Ru73]
MAEAVFRARVEEAGLAERVVVDSAGTGGWHEGDDADPRTLAVLREAGYALTHTARQFDPEWFARLDLIIALDSGHLRDLRAMAPTEAAAAKVRLLRACTLPEPVTHARPIPDLDVPDPYYGGMAGFEDCLAMVEAASEDLLTVVRGELAGRDPDHEKAESA